MFYFREDVSGKMSLQEIYRQCDTYVMCSTLNQLVNYLPYKTICKTRDEKGGKLSKEVQIINITYEENEATIHEKSVVGIKKQFNNKEWDGNFNSVLQNELERRVITDKNTIYVNREGVIELNYTNISNLLGKKVIWNLTGGQRNVIFAIERFIEQDKEERKHVVIYLEGNTQKILYGQYEKGKWKYEEDGCYECEELDLEKVFNLAGYTCKSKEKDDKSNSIKSIYFNNNQDKVNDKTNDEEFEEILSAYFGFYENYYAKDDKLRKQLIATNRKDENTKDKKNEKDKKDNPKIKAIEDILDKLGVDKEEILKLINKETDYPFGYMLEYMTVAVIKNIIDKDPFFSSKFVSLSHNVRVYSNKHQEGQFCELDAVLLSKSGQLIVFECKSGSMESEVAKAREYTAYVLGGVYGKPVLVTPLTADEIKKLVGESEKEERKNKKDKKDEYKYILKSIRAAGRAGLDICCIDTMKQDIKDKFEYVLG